MRVKRGAKERTCTSTGQCRPLSLFAQACPRLGSRGRYLDSQCAGVEESRSDRTVAGQAPALKAELSYSFSLDIWPQNEYSFILVNQEPAQPLSKIEQKKAEKRQRLLDAALELFAERGFHGTAVPLVAEKAGVGAGTLYRFFESKEALVNEVYRQAKGRLGAALGELDLALPPRQLFESFWQRLVDFARAEPVAFHFLELQDHAPYLDGESRAVEMTVLLPAFQACQRFQEQGAVRPDLPLDVMIALIWGAFVGLFKAERHGYLQLDDERLQRACDACWDALSTQS